MRAFHVFYAAVLCAELSAQAIQPPYFNSYSFVSLGSVPGSQLTMVASRSAHWSRTPFMSWAVPTVPPASYTRSTSRETPISTSRVSSGLLPWLQLPPTTMGAHNSGRTTCCSSPASRIMGSAKTNKVARAPIKSLV